MLRLKRLSTTCRKQKAQRPKFDQSSLKPGTTCYRISDKLRGLLSQFVKLSTLRQLPQPALFHSLMIWLMSAPHGVLH